MGHPVEDSSKLGAAASQSPRDRFRSNSGTHRPLARGGQASLGLFGCGPSITGRPIRAFQALADDQARKVFGLTCGQRRAVLQARTGSTVCPAPSSNLSAADSARLVLSFTELVAKHTKKGHADPVQEPAAPAATPAMLEAAAASDMREAFPFFSDEEPWERDTLFGHADLALAND